MKLGDREVTKMKEKINEMTPLLFYKCPKTHILGVEVKLHI